MEMAGEKQPIVVIVGAVLGKLGRAEDAERLVAGDRGRQVGKLARTRIGLAQAGAAGRN